MHEFVVYVCVCVCVCVCVRVHLCVCVCVWWNEFILIFVSALGTINNLLFIIWMTWRWVPFSSMPCRQAWKHWVGGRHWRVWSSAVWPVVVMVTVMPVAFPKSMEPSVPLLPMKGRTLSWCCRLPGETESGLPSCSFQKCMDHHKEKTTNNNKSAAFSSLSFPVFLCTVWCCTLYFILAILV